MKISIDELQLSTRTCNALHRIGIHTIDELLDTSLELLANKKGFGQSIISEILHLKSEYHTDKANFYNNKHVLSIYEQLSTSLYLIFGLSKDAICKLVYDYHLNTLVESLNLSNITLQDLHTLLQIPQFQSKIHKYVHKLTSKKNGLLIEDFVAHFKIFTPKIIEEALLEEIWNHNLIIAKYGYALPKRMSLQSVINQIQMCDNPSRNQLILLSRLEGNTLENIGNQFSLTRERVRQIIYQQLTVIPELEEDYYSSIFSYFSMDKQIFFSLFKDECLTTYNYLCMRYKKGMCEWNYRTASTYTGLFSETAKQYFNG